MSTLILTCFAIQSATDTAAFNIRTSLKSGFTINAKSVDTQLEGHIVSGIMDTNGIAADFNLRSYFYAEYYSLNGQLLDITTDGAIEIPEGYEHAGKMVSNTYSNMDTYFLEAGFELIEGQHITANDRNVIIISETFASQNGLSIGDTLVLGGIGETDGHVKVEVVGIFKATLPLDAGVAPSYDLYENISFSDNETYSQLYYHDGDTHYQYGDFYVDDPAELDTILSDVMSISGIEWEKCIITVNDVDYQNAKAILETLQNLVTLIIFVVIGVSTLLLALILTLWVKNRIYETGILLAMGFCKRNILIQHLMEILMVAFVTFVFSFLTSSLIAQNIGEHLLNQAATENQVVETNLAEGTAEKNTETLTSIEVTVSFSNLLLIYIIGTGIVMLSILLSSYPIMRMKPKEILTKMS